MIAQEIINNKTYLGSGPYSSKSLTEIINMLFKDEKILLVASGSMETNGCIAITDKRVIFFAKNWLASSSKSINLTSVTSSNVQGMFGFSKIIVDAAGDKMTVTHMLTSDAETIKSKIDEAKYNLENVSSSSTPSEADELIKFADLLSKGLITEDEYNTKKKEILGL